MSSTKILIVQVDPSLSRDLEARVKALGHGVSAVVTSGRRALEAVAADRPDLVLVDLGLHEEMGGLETAYRIRFRFDVPVVFLIDTADERLPEPSEMPFPSGYISRPYQDGEIGIAIKRALRLEQEDPRTPVPGPPPTEIETRYQKILDTIEDGYYEVDLAGTMIVASESLCRLYGYTKEEFLGLNYRDYTNEATARKVFETYHRVFTTGEPVKKLDWEIIRRNGTKGHTEVSVSLIRDEHGQGIGFRGIVRDVTDRWRAEQALRASEERYRGILDSIEDVYYEVDLAGNLVMFSESLVRMYGYSRDELMGMNFRSYIHDDYLKEVYRTFNRVYTTGEPAIGFDWETVTKSGSTIHVEASISPVKDARGRAVGFRGMLRDITARHRAEQALKESEERYRSIFSNIEDAYFEVDLTGRLTFFNDALCRMYGYSPDELRGMDYREYIHPDDVEDVYQTYHRVFTTGQPTRGIGWKIVTKDGAWRYVESSINLIKDMSGRGVGFQGIVRDVTERQRAEDALRESEERYRLLAEEAHDVIWSVDLQTMRFTQISPAVERLLGLTEAEVLGRYFTEVFGPDLSDLVAEALDTDESEVDPADQDQRQTGEFQIGHRDGRTIWVEATIAFYRDDAGRPLGIVGVARDVTSRKQAEAEREELIATLQQTLTEVKTLSGLLPICANCKKVRDDSGYWQQLESYVSRHSQAQFSHGICPDCMKELYPEEYERLRTKNPRLFEPN